MLLTNAMDDMLAKAMADLGELERREADLVAALGELRPEITKLRDFIEMWQRYAAGNPSVIGGLGRVAKPSRKAARRPVMSGTGVVMGDAAVKALRDAGRPLTIGQILEAVQQAGVAVGGERPKTNLSSVLSRRDDLQYEQGVGWRLIEQDMMAEAIARNPDAPHG